MADVRRWHSYMGLSISPSVLFFALTGAVQLFNLHEGHGNYQPPAIIEKLSSVHKDQVFASGNHQLPAGPVEAGGTSDGDAGSRDHSGGERDSPGLTTPMLKAFFLAVALCLALSSGLGLWMGLTQTRNKWTALLLVVAGTVIPVSLLVF